MRRQDPELHADRRLTILEASLRAFARLGFHKATMPDIAREAGMSPANMYRYFASKHELVAALVEEERRDANVAMDQVIASDDLLEALIHALVIHAGTIDPAETALTLEILAQSLRDPVLGEMVRTADSELANRLATALEAGVASGLVRAGIDDRSAAAVILAMMDGLMWRRTVDPRFDAKSVASEMRAMLLAYLAPP